MLRAPAITLLALHGCGVAATGDPGPSPPPTVVAVQAASEHASAPTIPDDWPRDFPTVSGGVPRAAPAMGPVHVALLAYASDVEATDHAFREALTAAGWTIRDEAGDDHAHRFVAEHAATSVSVSIYADGGGTLVQTMQIQNGAEAER